MCRPYKSTGSSRASVSYMAKFFLGGGSRSALRSRRDFEYFYYLSTVPAIETLLLKDFLSFFLVSIVKTIRAKSGFYGSCLFTLDKIHLVVLVVLIG